MTRKTCLLAKRLVIIKVKVGKTKWLAVDCPTVVCDNVCLYAQKSPQINDYMFHVFLRVFFV